MGVIENRWRFSLSRRRALASFAAMFAASPLLNAQIDPHSLIGHKRIAAHRRAGGRVRLRGALLSQHDARAVRLHGARRRQRVEPAPQSPGVRLGRHRPGQGCRSGVGRHVVGDSWRADEVSDLHGAELRPGRAASRRRNRHVSRRHRGQRTRGVCQRHDGASSEDCASGDRPAMESVLSDPRPGRVGQAAADIPGSGRKGDHHHRRSAGVGLRARSARPSSRRRGPDGWRRRAWRWRRQRSGRGRSGCTCVRRAYSDNRVPASPASANFRHSRSIACRIAGFGTAGITSTKSASSSRCPSFSRASSRPKMPRSA